MRKILALLTSCLSFATHLAAADITPFHTTISTDDVLIDLTLDHISPSALRGFDYDVTIALSERGRKGETIFADRNGHAASVRCLPGQVMVGGKLYQPSPADAGADWKEDLVEAVCPVPSS